MFVLRKASSAKGGQLMTNSEIVGERLYELRKKHGLSQEAFAERLGVSRQAVSKWECGESIPDTDNLISISKMYNVSLDELVGNTVTQTEAELFKECDNVEELTPEYTDEKKDGAQENGTRKKKKVLFRIAYELPYPVLMALCFLLCGFLWGAWDVAWILFVTIPVYYSVVDCIRTKSLCPFAYPIFITAIYLFIGMRWGEWHPYWVIYITIPIFYAIADAVDRK